MRFHLDRLLNDVGIEVYSPRDAAIEVIPDAPESLLASLSGETIVAIHDEDALFAPTGLF